MKWAFLFLTCAQLQAGNLEAYGDSLTAGLLSGTKVTAPPSLEEISSILTDYGRFILTRDPRFMDRHHRKDLAWPEKISSLLPGNRPDKVLNLAVSRARSFNLSSQVELADPSTNTNAFFFIGHNDIEHPFNFFDCTVAAVLR